MTLHELSGRTGGKPGMVYFTSDLHLGSAEVIGKRHRPFSSVAEMNVRLIENYNRRVSPEDTVFLLGDICQDMPEEEANALIREMNGRKILLFGNHDLHYDPALFVRAEDFLMTDLSGRRFVLMHYPMTDWPMRKEGGIHLCGHLHTSMANNLKNRAAGWFRYDVGVDANEFRPVSLGEILHFYEGYSRYTGPCASEKSLLPSE